MALLSQARGQLLPVLGWEEALLWVEVLLELEAAGIAQTVSVVGAGASAKSWSVPSIWPCLKQKNMQSAHGNRPRLGMLA